MLPDHSCFSDLVDVHNLGPSAVNSVVERSGRRLWCLCQSSRHLLQPSTISTAHLEIGSSASKVSVPRTGLLTLFLNYAVGAARKESGRLHVGCLSGYLDVSGVPVYLERVETRSDQEPGAKKRLESGGGGWDRRQHDGTTKGTRAAFMWTPESSTSRKA